MKRRLQDKKDILKEQLTVFSDCIDEIKTFKQFEKETSLMLKIIALTAKDKKL